MSQVYSLYELLEIKKFPKTKDAPNTDSLIQINFLKSSIKLPIISKKKYSRNNNNNHHRNKSFNRDRNNNWERLPQTKPLVKSENAWKVDKDDVSDGKIIKGILNKLSVENYNIMIKQVVSINYTSPNVVDEIFNKAVTEPYFSDMYARFCMDLVDLHDLIREMCEEQFRKKKHKNLCKFIGELYKLKIITELTQFTDVLYSDIDTNHENLEILCKLITTVGVDNEQFEEILIQLDETKEFFKPRFKFMIMDVLDLNK